MTRRAGFSVVNGQVFVEDTIEWSHGHVPCLTERIDDE